MIYVDYVFFFLIKKTYFNSTIWRRSS